MIFLQNLATNLSKLGEKTPYFALIEQDGQDYLISSRKKSKSTRLESIHRSWCSTEKGSLGYLIADEIYWAKLPSNHQEETALILNDIRGKIVTALNNVCKQIEHKEHTFYFRLKQLLAKIFPYFFQQEPKRVLREKINILKGMQNKFNEMMEQ